MTRNWPTAIPLSLFCCLVLSVACTQGAHYGVRASLGKGSAYTPVEYSQSTTATVGYHEKGGVVSRALLSLLAIMSAAPATRTSTSVSSQTTNYGSQSVRTTTTTTTTTVTDSPEQIREKAVRATAMLNALETSAIPFEFNFDIALPSIAGNTSGYMWNFMYASEPAVSRALAFRFLVGIGGGKYRFKDLKSRRLVRNGSNIETQLDEEQNYTYNYLGMPVRLEASFRSGIVSYLQADLNIYSLSSLFDDDEASPFRIGLGRRISVLQLSAELAIDRWRKDGVTATLGASFVL